MHKIITAIVVLIFCSNVVGQTNEHTDTSFVLSEADSLAIIDSLRLELFGLLNTKATRAPSFAEVQAGFGTGYFTLKNPATSTVQSQLYYQTQFGYYHKSGVFAQVRLLSTLDNKALSLFQTSAAVGYQLVKKAYSVGASYTYFSSNNKVGFYTSPLDHDFYLNAKYRKTWLRPSIGLGYSMGNEKTVLAQRLRTITTENFVRDMYLIVNFDHNFQFKHGKTWIFTVVPSVSFFSSTSNYGINRSVSNIPSFLNQRRQLQLAALNGTEQQKDVFSLQSILATLQTDAHYKMLFGTVQLTANYNNQTASQRVTPFFVCSIGCNF